MIKNGVNEETAAYSKNHVKMRTQTSLMGDIFQTIVFTTIIPGILFILYLNNIIALGTIKVGLLVFFLLCIIGPLIFKYSISIQRQVIFLNYVYWPKNPNYSNPEEYGLNGTRNFVITTKDQVKLGTWHILPLNLVKDDYDRPEQFERALNNGQPVFVYMHGNSGNRAGGHRIELYRVLREKYHVIAFDYRSTHLLLDWQSYGDSSVVIPSENGVVQDATTVIQYVKNLTNSPIFVWGHSLGTGIATHTLHLMALEDQSVAGLVLESPFNSIRHEVKEHPSSMFFKNLPWFKYTIVNALYDSGFRFESDEHILYINCPILVLHAEDDMIVPFKLGYKLFSGATKLRTINQGAIRFEKFSSKLGYGHKYICRSPELPRIVEDLVLNANMD